MKFLSLLLLALLGMSSLPAQHCPYDGVYILVVDVHAVADSQTIPQLRLTLWDSLGRPAMRSYWVPEQLQWREDTLAFWINPPSSSPKGGIDPLDFLQPQKTHFWFAEDHYVLVCGSKFEGYTLKVEDIDGLENGGSFRTAQIPLQRDDAYSLCTGRSHWRWHQAPSFVAGYAPIEVVLPRI